MPLLFPNLRITQVFGANTDVGKTLLTTALVRATASQYAAQEPSPSQAGPSGSRKRVFYLKPVSTGPDEESDVAYVERHTKPYSDLIATHNLYQYREPMSPHLAAQLAPDLPFPKSNDELVRGIEDYSRLCLEQLQGRRGSMFVETAGGVHSPALHPPHTQSTFLRSLRLPGVLIAAPQLGGISTTLSSYESLLMRGYSISAVLCLHQPYYRNHTFLEEYFRDRKIPFWTIKAPPERYGTLAEDAARLAQWYADVEKAQEAGETGGGIGQAAQWLETEHGDRIAELEGMPGRTLDSVWWPFTQHGLVNKKEDVMVIDSAHGDSFDALYLPSSTHEVTPTESLLNSYFDGSASWFTQSHGHATEPLTLAAAEAAGRYGHVLFPSGTHKPALELAEKLLSTVGKGWADRVFYSDNGSTGIEVALKMGLRASGRRYGWKGEVGGDVGVIGLRGGYHGDTIGSMDASEKSTYNEVVDWYTGRGHWFSPPMVQYVSGKPTVLSTPPDEWRNLPKDVEGKKQSQAGWSIPFEDVQQIYDVPARSSTPLADYYRQHIRSHLEKLRSQGRRFGAVVMEPVCLGAGGMVFVDPLFQACLVEVVRASEDLFNPSSTPSSTAYQSALSSGQSRASSEWRGLPIIYDEVFSGLNRFGYLSAASVLGAYPDISVYAKILTGGLLPLSATLASSSIFSAFLSDQKVDALLHGHSYTANPIGCSVALRAIEMSESLSWPAEKALWGVEGTHEQGRWSFWSEEFVSALSRTKGVSGVMAMGTVLGVELQEADKGYSSHAALDFLTRLRGEVVSSPHGQFRDFRIHSRPLGNVVYIMTSLYTPPAVMRAMEAVISRKLQEAGAQEALRALFNSMSRRSLLVTHAE